MTKEEIKAQLESLNRQDLCEIYADKSVDVEELTTIMSLLNELGFTKIVIKTKNSVT